MIVSSVHLGNLIFSFELLVAQFLFTYSLPKRRHFFLRAIPFSLCFFVYSFFFPLPNEIKFTVWYSIIRFLSIFALSTLLCFSIYDVPYSTALSLCGAGYAVQHFSYQLALAFSQIPWYFNPIPAHRQIIYELCLFPITYFLFWFFFGKNAGKDMHLKTKDFRFDLIAISILFICIGLSRITRGSNDTKVILSTSAYAMTCCLSALIIQFYLKRSLELSYEKKLIRNLWDEDKKHYEISKEQMNLVNIQAHDLKHKITAFKGRLPDQEISSINKVIDDYDSHLKTGNEALDVILNEKSFICKKEGISFTFLGDGKQLDRIEVTDIYSLIGNAMDNAIEAVTKLKKEKRIISMNIESKGPMVFLSIRNYFLGELKKENDDILTTKTDHPDFHGFGLKSIRRIAEKYGGDIQIETKDDTFILNIYLQ